MKNLLYLWLLVFLCGLNLAFAIHGTAQWQIIMNAFASGFAAMSFIANCIILKS